MIALAPVAAFSLNPAPTINAQQAADLRVNASFQLDLTRNIWQGKFVITNPNSSEVVDSFSFPNLWELNATTAKRVELGREVSYQIDGDQIKMQFSPPILPGRQARVQLDVYTRLLNDYQSFQTMSIPGYPATRSAKIALNLESYALKLPAAPTYISSNRDYELEQDLELRDLSPVEITMGKQAHYQLQWEGREDAGLRPFYMQLSGQELVNYDLAGNANYFSDHQERIYSKSTIAQSAQIAVHTQPSGNGAAINETDEMLTIFDPIAKQIEYVDTKEQYNPLALVLWQGQAGFSHLDVGILNQPSAEFNANQLEPEVVFELPRSLMVGQIEALDLQIAHSDNEFLVVIEDPAAKLHPVVLPGSVAPSSPLVLGYDELLLWPQTRSESLQFEVLSFGQRQAISRDFTVKVTPDYTQLALIGGTLTALAFAIFQTYKLYRRFRFNFRKIINTARQIYVKIK